MCMGKIHTDIQIIPAGIVHHIDLILIPLWFLYNNLGLLGDNQKRNGQKQVIGNVSCLSMKVKSTLIFSFMWYWKTMNPLYKFSSEIHCVYSGEEEYIFIVFIFFHLIPCPKCVTVLIVPPWWRNILYRALHTWALYTIQLTWSLYLCILFQHLLVGRVYYVFWAVC